MSAKKCVNLKPCPFCGETEELVAVICGPSCWIKCANCDATGPDENFYDEDDGIPIGIDWNDRGDE